MFLKGESIYDVILIFLLFIQCYLFCIARRSLILIFQQLGRYRLEPEEGASERTAATAKKLQAEAVEQKKSVRFNEFDPREIWKEEKRARTWGAQFKRWKTQISPCENFFIFQNSLRVKKFQNIFDINNSIQSSFMTIRKQY